MLEKRNLPINVDSRMADIIRSSQMVAGKHTQFIAELVSKGRSHHLLKKKLLKDQREEKNRIEEEKEQTLLTVAPTFTSFYVLDFWLELSPEIKHIKRNECMNEEN